MLGRVSPNRRNHPDKKHHNIPAIEKLSRTSKSAARRCCSQYTCFETVFCNWTFRCSQITSITFVIHRIPNVETEWWDEIVAALSNPTAAWAKPLCLAGRQKCCRPARSKVGRFVHDSTTGRPKAINCIRACFATIAKYSAADGCETADRRYKMAWQLASS